MNTYRFKSDWNLTLDIKKKRKGRGLEGDEWGSIHPGHLREPHLVIWTNNSWRPPQLVSCDPDVIDSSGAGFRIPPPGGWRDRLSELKRPRNMVHPGRLSSGLRALGLQRRGHRGTLAIHRPKVRDERTNGQMSEEVAERSILKKNTVRGAQSNEQEGTRRAVNIKGRWCERASHTDVLGYGSATVSCFYVKLKEGIDADYDTRDGSICDKAFRVGFRDSGFDWRASRASE
ncbi:hypothetical protein BOTBODRAFT_143025, partial [Botryobasidium botryosum FD-172 SS1]